METEEGIENPADTECAKGVRCLKRKPIDDGVPISNGNGVFEEGRRSESEALNDGAVFTNGNGVADVAEVLKNDVLNNGVNGNCVAEEARESISEAVNDGAVVANGNGVADVGEVLKSDVLNNGVDGNGVAEDARHSESEAVNDGAVVSNGNNVTEEVGVLKSEAVNDGAVFSNGNGVAEEVGVLKSEAVSNGVASSGGFDSGDGGSGGVTCLRTYKRRKYDKSSSKGKAQEDCGKCVETASHIADQVEKEPLDATLGNTADDYAHIHWGSVVLKHLYQSLGNGGIAGCKGGALIHHQSCATTVMGTSKIGKDGQEFSSQFDRLSHRTRTEANGHAHVMQNGSTSEPHVHGVTEMCQRVLCNVLNSEEFNSLCRILFEKSQGMKPESVFDFSVITSRMKQKIYEQSPARFLSDIQQVFGKLKDTCNVILALSNSLSNISTNSYSELVGISAQSTFEDEKQVELDSHMKPEQTEECATYKVCCCSSCGERADGTDCLVCDSCEKVYHLSCIEPAVNEIPHKSWYCASCTTGGFGSPHENCVVCARLNDTKTPKKIIGDESLPTNEETLNEFDDNSNGSYDGIQVSTGEKVNCKVCGNEVEVRGGKIRICGHPFCPSKYYHARCLTSKQLVSYGSWWYCPSCICQVCLTDQDDSQIVLCDGCDHAYHIYCMKPPLDSIPAEKWFCRKCDAGLKAISQAKKAYESNKPRTGDNASKPNANNNCNNKCVEELESGGGMDMLLTAANCLNFVENLAENSLSSRGHGFS